MENVLIFRSEISESTSEIKGECRDVDGHRLLIGVLHFDECFYFNLKTVFISSIPLPDFPTLSCDVLLIFKKNPPSSSRI